MMSLRVMPSIEREGNRVEAVNGRWVVVSNEEFSSTLVIVLAYTLEVLACEEANPMVVYV